MADIDDELAAAAVELNEGAKAKRRAKKPTPPADFAAPEDEGDGEPFNPDEAWPPVAEDEGEPEGEGWDAEGEHTTAISRMEAMADELELNTSSMVFDVRDFLLNTIKARPKPWSATSQAEQRDVAAACEHAATEVVRKIAEAVSARGVDPVRVLLTKLTMGSDMVIAGKVKAMDPEEEDRAVTILHRAIGKHVMLTVASADDYKLTGREAETDPDEPGFGFEGDGDED